MNEDPGKMFLSNTGTASTRPDGVLQGLSQDLLQQAMHEVSQQNSTSIQEVKEEPGIYNRMERILANQEVRLGDISHLHSGVPVTVTESLDKVKLEPHTPKIVAGGGGGIIFTDFGIVNELQLALGLGKGGGAGGGEY